MRKSLKILNDLSEEVNMNNFYTIRMFAGGMITLHTSCEHTKMYEKLEDLGFKKITDSDDNISYIKDKIRIM